MPLRVAGATIAAAFMTLSGATPARAQVTGVNTGVVVPNQKPRTNMQVLGALQMPWQVAINPSANSVAIGSCQAVYIDLKDQAGKDTPRKPNGWRVDMADFDWTATEPTGAAAVGVYHGANSWTVCACQAAVVGTTIKVMATYPAAALADAQRMPGLAFRSYIELPVAPSHGASNPPGCEVLATTTVVTSLPTAGANPSSGSVSPGASQAGGAKAGGAQSGEALPGSLMPAQQTVPGPAPASVLLAPRGLAVRGTPSNAKLSWTQGLGASSYSVRRWNKQSPECCRTAAAGLSTTAWDDSNFPLSGVYVYEVTAHGDNGQARSSTIEFTRPEPVNPAGLTARQNGDGIVIVSWQAVPDAAFYQLWGPGITNTGMSVTGTSQQITGVPAGTGEWTIGSFYTPGPVSTSAGTFPKVSLNVTATVASTPPVQTPGTGAPAASPTVTSRPPSSPTAKWTTFEPKIHGFKFGNDFKNSFIGPPLNFTTSGLCGGMTYAVLDYYLGNNSVPAQQWRPANNTALQQYLYSRQVASLVSNMDKWAETTVNPFGSRSVEFFNWGLTGRLQELRSFIDRGIPVPLGLKGFALSAGDHQVLAIGYDLGRYNGDLSDYKTDVRIYIFDPNFPNSVQTLRPLPDDATYSYIEHPEKVWRTYFVDGKYSASVSPNIPQPVFAADGLVHKLLVEFETGNDDMRGGADHVDLTMTLADGTSQSYANISKGGMFLPAYTETVEVMLTTPIAASSIKRVEITTNATAGTNVDHWELNSVRINAIGNGIDVNLFGPQRQGPFTFTEARAPFVLFR
ncbi:MAG: hypothetical protein ABI311_14760 [Gemmatimonadaceae bacterium]